MKKATWLLLGCALAVCACRKDPVPATSQDADLTGETTDVSGFPSDIRKIFVLNEGTMGSNNATLDFLRIPDGVYVTGAFKKMNPTVGAGLGDVGNDIATWNDEVWIVINQSGIVEVLSAQDETEIAAITLPTPRSIAFDDSYAYVTSWAGAYAAGSYDSDGHYTAADSSNPKGRVYRINLKTKKIEGSVEVGYQPEGIACSNGRLYVANSGGISSQLPPDYSYDNTVSIIDAAAFQVVRTVEVTVNLKQVFADADGHVYVTTQGNYQDIHSGIWQIDGTTVRKISDYVSVAAMAGDTVYCIGTENEFDWAAPSRAYKGFRVHAGEKTGWDLSVEAQSLYGLAAVDADTFLIGDAGDYFNPGSVVCYNNGVRRWSVTAGVCPGHFAIW